MSVYLPSSDRLVTCPYDEVHKVKESRLQLHIAKCKLNHLEMTKQVCPFNATHLLQQGELDHHLINCPDRAPLDRHLAQGVNKNNPFKGRTSVPHYSDPIIDDENWEIGTTSVQLSSAPPDAVIEPPAMAKPSERRRLYKELHQRSSGVENPKSAIPPPSASVIPPPVRKPLRQPKNPSETEKFLDRQSGSYGIEGLGLGRGRGASRIAANFSQPSGVSSQGITYSNIVQDMGNLGLGRGRTNNANPAPSPIFNNDDDFPALGFGRGVNRR